MTADFTLSAIVDDLDPQLELKTADLEKLLEALCAAEHPGSFRVLFWLLLRTFQKDPDLHAAIVESWIPSEASLARLLEDAGKGGTRIVLSLEGVRGELKRIWQLCDDIGLANLVASNEPLAVVALAPMAALHTERQLDELIAAVSRGLQWKDPGEILSPDGDQEFDVEALVALAQTRLVRTGGGEALNIVVLRLMNVAESVN